MTRGTFITFEGGEGAGKSSLIKRLSKELERRGFGVLATIEPGGSSLGMQIRDWLLVPKSQRYVLPKAELMLFLADRAQHIEETILPALSQGKIVLCDRFNDSTVAYQGVGRGLGFDYVLQLCNLVTQGVQPDLTFLLDIDPIVGLNRAMGTNKPQAAKGQMDRIEQEHLEFHQKLRSGFHRLASIYPNRIITLDASNDEIAVFDQALSSLEGRLS